MRIESSVTSVSWIPSEALTGMPKLPFETGVFHYDDPPPERIDGLEALRAADRFRFANEMRAWIDVEDGRVVGHGQAGRGHMGSTTLRLGARSMTFAAIALPTVQVQQIVGDESVRFTQTAGGRAGVPTPRRVKHPPFMQVSAPLAWTTLALTLHADGRSEHEVVGASPFPRHWIYDTRGELVQKSGLVNFKHWYQNSFGTHTPWGDEDSPALVTEVETALERELSTHIMRSGTKPHIRKIRLGETLVEQGDSGAEVFLLLDGVLAVDVNGTTVGNVGPGAVLGERSLLETGQRTATLRAVTACKVAAISGSDLDPAQLAALSAGHKREEGGT
jgi:hypothetical protein